MDAWAGPRIEIPYVDEGPIFPHLDPEPDDSAALDPDERLEDELRFRREVHHEAGRIRVREAARRLVRLEQVTGVEPDFVALSDFLAVADEPERHRVHRLWPKGGRVVLAAPFKVGKTTLRNNLIHALADGEPFLGHFEVTPPDGRIALIDNELDERMLRRWLRDEGVRNADRVHVLPLRGKVGTFDVMDAESRARWAKRLRAIDAAVVVFDCLRPALDALGLSEDKDAGRFLVGFDALMSEAGADEGLVVHHAGHGGERSRGDSRLRDWPDVEWRMVREADGDAEADASARRFFSAYGRDVDVPEGLLTYDAVSRRLTYAGGNRKQTAGDAAIPELVEFVGANEGCSQNDVEKALTESGSLTRSKVREGLKRAIETGHIDVSVGPNRTRLHFLPARQEAS